MVMNRRWVGRVAVPLAAIATVGTLTAVPASSVVGEPTIDQAYRFLAKVDVGTAVDGGRSCTGVLVAPQWVITAKACFAEAGTPPAAGPPPRPSRAIVGRLDLTGTTGYSATVTLLVPHPTQDVVLARLDTRITDIAPVTLAASPAAAEEVVQVVGFGRTSTEWVPDKPHLAGFTVQAVSDTQVTVAGASAGASICKGDAGGPALRVVGGQNQLLAINSTSWQGGCLGSEPETRTGGIQTRVDDLGDWIRDNMIEPDVPRGTVKLASGLLNRDDYADLTGVLPATGELFLFPGTAVGGVFNKRVQLGRSGWNGMHDLVLGRFNPDGFDDLGAAESSTGKLWLYPGIAAGNGLGTRVEIGSGGWNGMHDLVGGLYNRDAYPDLVAAESSTGKLWLYPGTAAGGPLGTRVEIGSGGWNNMTELTAGLFSRDSYPDLLAVDKTTGKLWLYPGTAAGGPFGSRVELG